VDYGAQPVPWIAMEYMDGGHLGGYAGHLDTRQALWTAIAITKGVRHAHNRGIAHLDLKPQNVLFRTTEDDQAWDVPKVADWGLSKHLLDHSKSIEGYTPTYSAPEQLDREYGSADDITDVYQLGAVFYELFTGTPPFDGESTGQVVRQVLDEELAPPSELADVPDALDDILLMALAKPKDHRYEDIIFLRNALQDLYEEWS
jgi:serine/threonine protein kinase